MDGTQEVYNAHVERVRCTEYPGLLKTTYLDHAGTTLYASSLIDAYHKDLASNLYGNPHSDSPASDLSTQRVDEARIAVLRYLNADPDQFDLVFAANATAAIKLVADCFRDQDFWYGYHKDAHNSIVGVRELANGGSRCFASNQQVEQWIEQQMAVPPPSTGLQLFAYPAQSNMTGYRLPYRWSKQIHAASQDHKQKTFVLLDAASYLTSGRLDLADADAAPDFIALSFYKIFGYPDLGALVVKKSAFDVMTHRRYFGGGTVEQVIVLDASFHSNRRENLHDFLEDGTLPFHNIVALQHAIEVHAKLFGTSTQISNHTAFISGTLHEKLQQLKHSNGRPVVVFYKDKNATYGDSTTQGPIMAFNALRPDGTCVGKSHFERLAIDCGFQVRTGAVCNPGGLASVLDLKHWELRRNYTEGANCGTDIDTIGAKPTGIVRVSLGPMSTLSDVTRFVDFVTYFFTGPAQAAVPGEISSLDEGTRVASKRVQPIDGCHGFTVKSPDYAAYELWDRRWCIADLTGGKVITPASIQDLSINIDVEIGEMILSHRQHGSLKMSLWDVPEVPKAELRAKPVLASDERRFDLYIDSRINDWLSGTMGTPCKLARYRGDDTRRRADAGTCIVAGCHTQCQDPDALRHHYCSHAVEFLASHPLEIEGKGPRRASVFRIWREAVHNWKKTERRSSSSRRSERPLTSTGSHTSSTLRGGSHPLRNVDEKGPLPFVKNFANASVFSVDVLPPRVKHNSRSRA